MKSNNYKELFKLVQKAERYKKQNLKSKELDIYIEIHKNYRPNTSKLFKRPAVLFEKKGEFQKALDICNKAILLINEDKISGTVSSFEKMKKILERKLNDTNSNTNKYTKHILIPTISITSILIILVIASSLYFLSKKENTYDNIQIDLSEMKRQSQLEGEIFDKEKINDFPITKDMINNARTIINTESNVINSVILNDNTSIGFGLLIKKDTSYTNAKDLSNSFVKTLGKIASSEYNLNQSNLGEIYDYYSIYISVGTSNKKEDIILKGYKIKGANKLNYK